MKQILPLLLFCSLHDLLPAYLCPQFSIVINFFCVWQNTPNRLTQWRRYTASWWERHRNSDSTVMMLTWRWGILNSLHLCNNNRTHTGWRAQSVSCKAHPPETHFLYPDLHPKFQNLPNQHCHLKVKDLNMSLWVAFQIPAWFTWLDVWGAAFPGHTLCCLRVKHLLPLRTSPWCGSHVPSFRPQACTHSLDHRPSLEIVFFNFPKRNFVCLAYYVKLASYTVLITHAKCSLNNH